MIKNIIKINVPFNTKIIIWNKTNTIDNNLKIFLVSDEKIFKINLNLNNKSLFIDKWSNTILLKKKLINCLDNKINNMFNFFLKSWNNYFFNKIKFKGKGFRIKFFKKIKLIKFYFGRSHKTFMLLKKIKRKRINKYKFMIIGLTKKNVINNSINITNIKPINIYTLRGLRRSNQIIFKRKGKKGTYI